MNINKSIFFLFGKLNKLTLLKPYLRRLILISIDLIIILLSCILIFCIQSSDISLVENRNIIWFFTLTSFIGIPIFIYTGQYRSLSGYFGSKLIYHIALRNILLVLITLIFGIISGLTLLPAYLLIIFCLINTNSSILIRIIIKDLISINNKINQIDAPKVVIYGAGSAGAQLAESINLSGSHKILYFVDDNPSLWGRSVNSIKIISPKLIETISSKLDYVLIAIPSISRNLKKQLINSLSRYKIKILEIPSIEELTLGKALINTLRPIKFNDLLGRDPVKVKSELLGPRIKNSNILVTGAGGSIGSELCRQIIALKPKKLVILENNELALYSIEKEIKELSFNEVNVLPILGNVTNEILLQEIFFQNKISIVFHAAAYKHVPLVESNPIEGLRNNVISSYLICKVSESSKYKPKNVVLISSDKAVRPTNIMGASKRLSELIFQSFALKAESTFYSMVRFGNVIGSSGSVVPQFKKQIENGGPITLTHPEIIRYFMTINEACGLVLQTIELSKGGDIFLLDMGKPIKILDLAKHMISLSGLKVLDEQNPDGDIEIVTTGLRPGEKLYEELLINGKFESTINSLIFRANDEFKINYNLLKEVELLIDYLKKRKKKESLSLLLKLVPEWRNSKEHSNLD